MPPFAVLQASYRTHHKSQIDDHLHRQPLSDAIFSTLIEANRPPYLTILSPKSSLLYTMKPLPDSSPFLSGMAQKNRTRGLTLIELLVTLVILIGLGSIVVEIMGDGASVAGADGVSRTDNEIVTLSTIRTVRDVLVGSSPTDSGYFQHLDELPESLGALVANIYGDSDYDPATKRGWRGPYLADGGGRYGAYLVSGDNFPDNTDIAGIEDDPAVLDGWGKPLLIQEPNDLDFARLVSAGENGILETNSTNEIDTDRGDDLVLFLFSSDPNL